MFEKYNSVAALFVDVQGMYNKVLYDILIIKLNLIGIPRNTLKFIFNIVNKRIINIRFDSINEIRNVYRGFPQGSMLSPLLFSLYIKHLEEVILLCNNINILQVADDVCIYTLFFIILALGWK